MSAMEDRVARWSDQHCYVIVKQEQLISERERHDGTVKKQNEAVYCRESVPAASL